MRVLKPTWSEEMSQGLFAEEDKEDNEAESDHEGMLAGPVRAVDRKTKQQRRKEREQQEEVNNLLITCTYLPLSILLLFMISIHN